MFRNDKIPDFIVISELLDDALEIFIQYKHKIILPSKYIFKITDTTSLKVISYIEKYVIKFTCSRKVILLVFLY